MDALDWWTWAGAAWLHDERRCAAGGMVERWREKTLASLRLVRLGGGARLNGWVCAGGVPRVAVALVELA